MTAVFSRELIAWMSEMAADELATKLTGGVILEELPEDIVAVGRALSDRLRYPAARNQLFMRDTSAWIYGGVSINSMYWPARQNETLNLEAVYRPPALPRLGDLVQGRRPRHGVRPRSRAAT